MRTTTSLISTLEQIKALPLGTKLYSPTSTHINWWYYAGINPKSDKSIMLITAGNVNELQGRYIADKEVEYYTDYEEAKMVLLQNAYENIERIKEIYNPNSAIPSHEIKCERLEDENDVLKKILYNFQKAFYSGSPDDLQNLVYEAQKIIPWQPS